jgi:glycosyltransferase involved in cell wall biosynthesis
MKIGVILYPYGVKQPAGLTETILSLSKGLVEVESGHDFVFFVRGEAPILPKFLDGTRHEMRRAADTLFWLDDAVKKGSDIDVWVINTPMMPIFNIPNKTIVIALDFAFLHYPSSDLKGKLNEKIIELLQARALRKSTHIVSISEYTKQEVSRWFSKIKPVKITTIMAGYRDLHNIPTEKFQFELPEKYLLSLGVIKYRKNQLNIVKGFLLAKEKGLPCGLVVCGKGSGPYMEEIFKAAYESKYKDDIVFTGYVSDGQIVAAYQAATALVFPSRMEGFGFPVLEAMSMGTPVITANTNSVAEVAGEAAITVNPESPEEIADAMLRMSSVETQQKYRDLGYTRLKEFSWGKTAQKLISVVEQL